MSQPQPDLTPRPQPSVVDLNGVIPPPEPYRSLQNVLDRAFAQAASGKGHDRHANGLSFEQQPMQTISDSLGTNAGLLFQAAKKAQESQRMDRDAAVRELLGAINYLAGAIVWLENRK